MYQVAITKKGAEFVTDAKEARIAVRAVFGTSPRVTDLGWGDMGMWAISVPRGTSDGEYTSFDGEYTITIDKGGN